ncbi:hypothetical protein Droror1_Dr00015159 [Drosera rotundifolia]
MYQNEKNNSWLGFILKGETNSICSSTGTMDIRSSPRSNSNKLFQLETVCINSAEIPEKKQLPASPRQAVGFASMALLSLYMLDRSIQRHQLRRQNSSITEQPHCHEPKYSKHYTNLRSHPATTIHPKP